MVVVKVPSNEWSGGLVTKHPHQLEYPEKTSKQYRDVDFRSLLVVLRTTLTSLADCTVPKKYKFESKMTRPAISSLNTQMLCCRASLRMHQCYHAVPPNFLNYLNTRCVKVKTVSLSLSYNTTYHERAYMNRIMAELCSWKDSKGQYLFIRKP